MINKAQEHVDELIAKCVEIGLTNEMAIKCATVHINQTLSQINSTQKTILYKDMYIILNKLQYV